MDLGLGSLKLLTLALYENLIKVVACEIMILKAENMCICSINGDLL